MLTQRFFRNILRSYSNTKDQFNRNMYKLELIVLIIIIIVINYILIYSNRFKEYFYAPTVLVTVYIYLSFFRCCISHQFSSESIHTVFTIYQIILIKRDKLLISVQLTNHWFTGLVKFITDTTFKIIA